MNKNDTGLILLDQDNEPFFTFYQAKNKTEVPLSSIPLTTQEAFISSEDKNFYKHPGFSIAGIVRSLVLDIHEKEFAYGGSTITQQLVKSSLLSSNKNIARKLQEIILASEIERRYTKQEILEMYLNSVYFGEGAFGIEDAAHTYFNKDVSQLSIGESALLAGILPAPSKLSPLSGDVSKAKQRQRYVLEEMVKSHFISQQQAITLANQPIALNPSGDTLNTVAPHFALMVRDSLIDKFGEEAVARSGFRVKTTLHRAWQQLAEEVVKNQVAKLAVDGASNGAVVIEDPKTGEIKALVGSKDWYNNSFGKVNIAISNRQPGSSFKPIVYAAALESRLITPMSTLPDSPTTFPGNYAPQDYDKKYRGIVTVRRALSNSLNIPAVAVLQKVGVAQGIDYAKKLGITTLEDPSQYGLSLVLGAGEVKLLEMTNVYATFANKGYKNDPTLILEIADKSGNILYSYAPKNEKVIPEEVAFLISSILSDNKARAEEFGPTLTISRPAAVKTGTTENYRDAWTLGYTPSLTIGVWVGNNNNTSMNQIAGSLGAAPIWRSLMEDLLRDTPVEAFVPPGNIIAQSVCIPSGAGPLIASSSGVMEYFIAGTQPSAPCRYIPPAPIAKQPVVSPPPTVIPSQSLSPIPTIPISLTPPSSAPPQSQVAEQRGRDNKPGKDH